MKINRVKFLELLKVLKLGLAGKKEVIEQSNCMVFVDGRIWTYNDDVAVSVDFDIQEGREFAVPAKSLMSILDKLPDGEMDIQLSDSKLSFKVGKNRRVGINIEQEVVLPVKDIGATEEWKTLPDGFGQALNMTGFSCATHALGGRAAMMNIAVYPTFAISCDVFRATRYELDGELDDEMMIPGKCSTAISEHNPVEYGLSSGWLHLRNEEGIVLSVRLDHDEYPLDKVLELFEVEGEFLELPEGLKKSVECASVFSDQDGKHMVTLAIKNGYLVVEGTNTEGFFKERIKIEADDLKFQIDPELLLDCISLGSSLLVTDSLVCIEGEHFKHVAALMVD